MTTRSWILSTPELMSSRPEIIRSSVDFPQPEGPTTTTAVVDRKIDSANDIDLAEVLLDVAEGETGHGNVRYAAGLRFSPSRLTCAKLSIIWRRAMR